MHVNTSKLLELMTDRHSRYIFSPTLVSEFMKKGADASAKDCKGNYPVHYAAKSGAGQALQDSF